MIRIFGGSTSLDWFRRVAQRRVEVKFKNWLERNKPGSVRISSRIVTVTDQGLECEADERNAEIVIKRPVRAERR